MYTYVHIECLQCYSTADRMCILYVGIVCGKLCIQPTNDLRE